MARAKRTDRADARRRYRATQAPIPDDALDDVDDADADADAETPAEDAPRSRSAQSASQRGGGTAGRSAGSAQPVFSPGQRPSFTASFRAAARPFNVRQDIAYIPDMALHSHAVWAPAAAAVGSGALFLASQPLGSNPIANLLFQLFVLPPTIAGSFLAGILAKRATYIAGGIAALVGALVFSFAVFATPGNLSSATIAGASPSPSVSASAEASSAPSGSPTTAASTSATPSISATPVPSASPAPTPAAPLTDADKFGAALQSILISVPFGIAIGAFGGYYKRFLYVSNPARQRREIEQRRQKAQRQQPPKKRF